MTLSHDHPATPRPAAPTPAAGTVRAADEARTRVVTRVFLGLLAVLVTVYVIEDAVDVRNAAFVVARVASVAAFTYGVRTARRGFRRDWRLMLAAMYVWVAGDLIGAASIDRDGVPTAWQPAVLLSAAAFGLMTVGVVGLARRDGWARAATVGHDATVYVIGAVLVWWVAVGQELFAHPVSSASAVAAAVIPLGDGVLLGAVAALMSSRAAHTVSSRALAAFCLLGLAGDLGFARLALGQEAPIPAVIPFVWMLQFAAAAVAALHSERAATHTDDHASVFVSTLVLVALAAPPLLLGHASQGDHGALHHHGATLPLVTAGTVLVTGLVVARTRRLYRDIECQARQLEHTARTDELTQLPNRRAGARLLDEAIAAARDGAGDLHVAILDIDHFKSYNDTYGHQRGDDLLRTAGRTWSDVVAGDAVLFRYGGEEFVALVPGLCTDDAQALLRRLQHATPNGQTFSAGLVRLRADDDAGSVVRRADECLYAAKAAGRDRTVVG